MYKKNMQAEQTFIMFFMQLSSNSFLLKKIFKLKTILQILDCVTIEKIKRKKKKRTKLPNILNFSYNFNKNFMAYIKDHI